MVEGLAFHPHARIGGRFGPATVGNRLGIDAMEIIDAYRPAQWSDVVGQEKALKQIELWRRRGMLGRKVWISGKSGTGKTTIARMIAAEVADATCVTEIMAKQITVADIRDEFRKLRCRALFGNVKGWKHHARRIQA